MFRLSRVVRGEGGSSGETVEVVGGRVWGRTTKGEGGLCGPCSGEVQIRTTRYLEGVEGEGRDKEPNKRRYRQYRLTR